MTYYLCERIEYAPCFGFNVVILAFLTGIFASKLANYTMNLDEGKLLYFMAFVVTVLWVILASNNSYSEGAKSEL